MASSRVIDYRERIKRAHPPRPKPNKESKPHASVYRPRKLDVLAVPYSFGTHKSYADAADYQGFKPLTDLSLFKMRDKRLAEELAAARDAYDAQVAYETDAWHKFHAFKRSVAATDKYYLSLEQAYRDQLRQERANTAGLLQALDTGMTPSAPVSHSSSSSSSAAVAAPLRIPPALTEAHIMPFLRGSGPIRRENHRAQKLKKK